MNKKPKYWSSATDFVKKDNVMKKLIQNIKIRLFQVEEICSTHYAKVFWPAN